MKYGDIPIKTLFPSGFPKNLTEINDPPKKLYVKGALPTNCIYLTVVGSRKHTSYGAEACGEIIRGLAGYPVAIVSGLALGIDTVAHKEALTAGLPTVAIPGSGLGEKVLYPAQNRHLASQILSAGGALITEYEEDMKALNFMFPKRNRIMAGIADGILVVEAREKSGSLITAHLGLDYNRFIFAIPGPITSAASAGTHLLIKEGAIPVRYSGEVLDVFGIIQKTKREVTASLSSDETDFLLALRETGEKDSLIRFLKWDIKKMNEIASQLELKGIIKNSLDGFIKRNTATS